MSEKYDHKKIEAKWQEIWQKTKIDETDLNSSKPKHYNLVMFPYPSGEYLHIGHSYSYSGADVFARYKRIQGFNVFEPIGYDSFGLPAENFAIKKGVHPKQSTTENIAHAEKQLKSLGCMFDWSKTLTTSDPSYYKWTQWLFLKLYEKGLVYQKEAPVNWCPKCLTVLANEQVIDGLCERCDSEVVQKKMKQWFFKTTAYAERLIKDLDKVDWPDSSIIKQRNWIGKSEGVEFEMEIKGYKEKISTYTTRIDTVFGMTYVVLAPEHELVSKITTPEHKKEVEDYQIKTQKMTEIERQSLEKEKTGVFTGAFVINPFNNKKVPIWIADYVIMSYGTGAVMAVPAHDERDFEFAQKYNLPIKIVIEPETGKPKKDEEHRRSIVAIVRNPQNGKLLSINWKFHKNENHFIGGGIHNIEDSEQCAKREITEETGYKNVKLITKSETIHHHYRSMASMKNRYIDAIGFLFEIENKERIEPILEEHEKDKFTVEWITEEEADKKVIDPLHRYLFEKFIKNKTYVGYGILTNSGEFSGLTFQEAIEKMAEWLNKRKIGGKKINYRLRDWSIGRQRYWGAPIPIIYCRKCWEIKNQKSKIKNEEDLQPTIINRKEYAIIPVPEKDLPVLLPELDIKQVQPKGTGKGPLAQVKEFIETTCPKCGGKAERETDTMDTFVCSSFYFLRYPSVGNDKEMMEKEITKKWLPVDMYVGGAEHVTMHLLYARFITKALFNAKLINFDEPFSCLRHQGMIQGPDGKKMSKSKGNVVIPDEVIKEFGADTFRAYILFMGPFEDGGPWNPKGIIGVKRFLDRYWNLAREITKTDVPENPEDLIYSSREIEETALQRIVHKTIKKVGEDIEGFRFNTAVSTLMECLNEMYEIKEKLEFRESPAFWRKAVEQFTILLSPFAPHIAEEVWEKLGQHESVFTAQWPKYDKKLIKEDIAILVVQVNGKLRDTVEITPGISKEQAEKEALKSQKIQKWLGGKKVVKSIFVPDKLINLIVS